MPPHLCAVMVWNDLGVWSPVHGHLEKVSRHPWKTWRIGYFRFTQETLVSSKGTEGLSLLFSILGLAFPCSSLCCPTEYKELGLWWNPILLPLMWAPFSSSQAHSVNSAPTSASKTASYTLMAKRHVQAFWLSCQAVTVALAPLPFLFLIIPKPSETPPSEAHKTHPRFTSFDSRNPTTWRSA